MMYKVLIVDDHESMCDSLRYAFENESDFSVVGQIKNADLVDLYYEKLCPDLIFMDVCTENGSSGLNSTKIIREKYPDVKVIVMSGFDEITYAPRAKEAGAHAFIFKSEGLSFFVKIAKDVMQGSTCFPEPKPIPMPIDIVPLTQREMEVLKLVCKHLTSKEIADELFISENTVKYHKANMLSKTGFSRIVDLAFYVMSNGWINPLY